MNDPRIEVMAVAIYGDVNKPHARDKGWAEVSPSWRESYRSNARAALAAINKAATITTAEGLDALPVESVVRDAYGIVFENDLLDQSKARKWATLIDNELVASARISLPARVLHLGGS